MRFIFIAVKYRMQPFSWSTLNVLLLGGSIIFINSLCQTNAHPLVNIFIRSTLIASLFVGGAIAMKASEDVNKLFFNVLEKTKLYFQKV